VKSREIGSAKAKVPRFSNNIRAIKFVVRIVAARNHCAGTALLSIDRDGAGVVGHILNLADCGAMVAEMLLLAAIAWVISM
jgi:hypothetical protein